MNVIIPIAGLGSRFVKKGYTVFKPFIDIHGIPMIEWALSSLKMKAKYHIIMRSDEDFKRLEDIVKKIEIEATLHSIDHLTKGAAETCLFVKDFIDPDDELIITNCDQFTPWNPSSFIEKTKKCDSLVTIYDHGDIVEEENSPYSFVKLDKRGYAEKFAEKFAISRNALNGIHYWKKASYFFNSAEKLIIDESIAQEKFISLTFNYMIDEGKKIMVHEMKKGEFYSLGTPEEIEKNSHLLSKYVKT
jgi:NDP-sugar pyrophosphorylase family protein